MSENFFELSHKDQREALEYGRAETGRPAHLLEKDIWVVWALRTLFDALLQACSAIEKTINMSTVAK